MSLVRYRARAEHLTTKTVKDDNAEGGERQELDGGSTHHPELTEFTGLVTRLHKPESKNAPTKADIVIFAPGRAPEHVAEVVEGDDEGEFEFV